MKIVLVLQWRPLTLKRIIVLHFYSSLNFKISKIHSRVAFKVIYKLVNEINCLLPKDPFPVINSWGIYYIPCDCSLGCIVQTKEPSNIVWLNTCGESPNKSFASLQSLNIRGVLVTLSNFMTLRSSLSNVFFWNSITWFLWKSFRFCQF